MTNPFVAVRWIRIANVAIGLHFTRKTFTVALLERPAHVSDRRDSVLSASFVEYVRDDADKKIERRHFPVRFLTFIQSAPVGIGKCQRDLLDFCGFGTDRRTVLTKSFQLNRLLLAEH